MFRSLRNGAIVPSVPLNQSVDIDHQTGGHIGEKSKGERRYVARLDAVLLVFVCISQVIKYLDQSNVSAAYVSGMKEGDGDRIQPVHNVGYAVFLVPSQIIITMVRPSWWLPSLEVVWGVLTLCLYKGQNHSQVYALRALIGAFEASCYPGAITLLMSWYTPRELALRIGLYQSCQSLGGMLAGALQAAIYNTLNGVNGLAGWRWMFLIDGLMTIAGALLGTVMIPDYPSKPNPWAFWLKPRHIEIALERSKRFRRADNKRFTFKAVFRTAMQPHNYILAGMYIASIMAPTGYNYFNLFLKSLTNSDGTPRWSVAQLNAIPIGGAAIGMVCIWFWGFLSDYFQTRWTLVVIQAAIGLIPSIMLSVWEIPLGAKYAAFFMVYLSLGTAPPILAWMSDMNPHDAEQRAFLLGCCIALYYAMSAWSTPLIWPAYEAPHYSHAWQVSIGLWLYIIVSACALRYWDIHHVRPRNQKIALEIYGDPTETRYERAEGFEEAKDVVHEDVQVVNLKR